MLKNINKVCPQVFCLRVKLIKIVIFHCKHDSFRYKFTTGVFIFYCFLILHRNFDDNAHGIFVIAINPKRTFSNVFVSNKFFVPKKIIFKKNFTWKMLHFQFKKELYTEFLLILLIMQKKNNFKHYFKVPVVFASKTITAPNLKRRWRREQKSRSRSGDLDSWRRTFFYLLQK